MLFSKRLELEKQYYEWLKKDADVKIKDCPLNVITFLDSIEKLTSHNSDYEECPECGGSPVIKEGINKNCEYCGHWW